MSIRVRHVSQPKTTSQKKFRFINKDEACASSKKLKFKK